MVHPTELLRSPSDVGAFSAPVGTVHAEPPDCGLGLLPWLSARLKLEKCNRNTVFVSLLVALTVLHASASTYFVGTAKIWRLNYHMSEVTAEWLVYLSPIFGGLFALVVSHYGNLIHRPSYIGGLAMLHAVGGWLLILPELYHPAFAYLNTTAVSDQTLCHLEQSSTNVIKSYSSTDEYDEGKQYIALFIMVAYQLMDGLAFVSMVSHGVSYIDDGTTKHMTPTYICLLVAVAQIGRFVGLNLTLIPVAFNRHIFFSIAWLVTMTGIFIFGFLISLFTKLPHKMILRAGVNTLLQRQSTNQMRVRDQTKDLGFCQTISSLFTSNHLLLNTLAATFMHVAVVNFNAMREEFFRSRFVNFADAFDYRFSFYNVSALLFMCIIVVVMSQIFHRARPTTRFFVVWLIVAYVAIMAIFSSYAFLKCEDETSLMKYKKPLGGCNAGCGCNLDLFQPVCLEEKTYYSACFAGCTHKDQNGYSNCKCSRISYSLASEGSCNQDKCKIVAFFAEANSVITFGLIVSAYIVHLIIALRTVSHHRLGASSIGLLLLGVQLLPYLPFKVIYEVIKSTHCTISHNHECFIFTEHFALIISLVTLAFMVLSIILALFMLRGAGQVAMYARRGSRQLGMPSIRVIERRIDALQEEDENEEEEEEEEREEGNISHAQIHSSHAPNNNGNGNQEGDDENLRKTEHHEQSLRKSLHQVMSSAARLSSNGSVQPPSHASFETTPLHPNPPLQKQANVSSDNDIYSSCDSLSIYESSAPNHRAPPLETDSDGIGDSDIDLELARLELEKSPKCLKRESTFNETNL